MTNKPLNILVLEQDELTPETIAMDILRCHEAKQ